MKHRATLLGINEAGRLLNMKPGDNEIFFAPNGFKKKMSALGGYFHRVGGSHLFKQVGVYGVIPKSREVIEIVLVTRLDNPVENA